MKALRYLSSCACLLVLCGTASHAETAPAEHKPAAYTRCRDEARDEAMRGHDRVGRLLGKLNLTADQKVRIKSIEEQMKPQWTSLLSSEQTTREQLAVLPPVDANYAALIATAKANVAAMVQLRADTWTQIYQVLTPAQQAEIPAAVESLRQSRHEPHDAGHKKSAH